MPIMQTIIQILIHIKSWIYYIYGDSPDISKIVTLLQESHEHNKRFTLFTYSDDWSAKINQELIGDEITTIYVMHW